MELDAYYKLISSETKARKYLLGKCFKNHQRFSLVVAAESSINYKRDVLVVPVVTTPSRISPDGGSTGVG
jgi:hypothetical protein